MKYAVRALQLALPMVAALLVAPISSLGWRGWPWNPRLVDLRVYLHAGDLVRAGFDASLLTDSDPFTKGLVFTYPPFAALVAVPLSIPPPLLVGFLWTIASGLALYLVLHRFGLRGWTLALVSAVSLVAVEPIRTTLPFGQVNLFLMLMVVYDLLPSSATHFVFSVRQKSAQSRHRLIPPGVLTGAATAIKLTPGLFIVYLMFARRWRAVAWASGAFAVCTAIAFFLLPKASVGYVQGLLGGDNRTGYLYTQINQSITGTFSRLGHGDVSWAIAGMVIGGLVGLVGAWAAAGWCRLGHPRFALVLCATAALLASPVSWNHHFVWVLPLAIVLLTERSASPGDASSFRSGPVRLIGRGGLPMAMRVTGMAFAVWMGLKVYIKGGPSGHHLELTYPAWKTLVSAGGAILGVIFIIASAYFARRGSSNGSSFPAEPQRIADVSKVASGSGQRT